MKLKELRGHATSMSLSMDRAEVIELLDDIERELDVAFQKGKEVAKEQVDGPTLSAWVELRRQVDQIEHSMLSWNEWRAKVVKAMT